MDTKDLEAKIDALVSPDDISKVYAFLASDDDGRARPTLHSLAHGVANVFNRWDDDPKIGSVCTHALHGFGEDWQKALDLALSASR